MNKKNSELDKKIIDTLKDLDPNVNSTLFVHVSKESDKNFISYFMEANVDDLSSIILQLMKEPGFKSALYFSLLTLFQSDEKEKEYFRSALNLMDKIDIANMN